MRTITNVFLLNLAISDILLGVLCMPITLVGTLLRHFIFGEYFCKLIQFSQAASVAVSSWTLVAISCERYYAICHPLRSRTWQTINHANKIIALIWIGSILCMMPIALFSQLIPTRQHGLRKCREVWPTNALGYERTYNIFLDLVLLVFPLLILCFTYFLITRTLYVSMRNERAMIFGSSYNTTNKRYKNEMNTYQVVVGEQSNRAISFQVNTRDKTRYVSAIGCGYCADSSSYFADSESTSTEYEITYPEVTKLSQKHKNNQRNKYQQDMKLYDYSSHGSNKRNIPSSYNEKRHLYCMRTDSIKSFKHSNDGIEVINMPNQHRFHIQQEKRKSCSAANSRMTDTGLLRRSNETKTLESKKRVVKMLFVLVLEFFICWTPLYVINTAAMFIGPNLYEYVDYTSISFLQLLAYSSSCCNPITYCFMNANFRRAFRDTFKGIRISQCFFWQRPDARRENNLSIAGNSIALANSVMSTHTYLESPRL